MELITSKSKIVTHFIVLSLLIIATGKVFLYRPDSYLPLYIYGVSVTLVVLTTFFVTFTRYKDPYEIALEKNKVAKNLMVSCMVAVKDEEDVIEKCIQSLTGQSYQNKEVIFVNDGSTDKTGDILREYAASGKIILIDLKKNVGKKRALGQAMRIAKGDIFAFSDSDSVWAKEAIDRIVKIFETDEMVGAVSGHCRAWNANASMLTKIQDSWYEGQFSIRKAFESVFGAITCVSGPLAVFRKEAIYNFIPAWENDTFLGQEFKFATDRTLTGFVLGSSYIGVKLKKKFNDSDFVKSIDYPNKEWKIVYCKSAKAWTNVPDTWKRMLKQQIRWKKSFIRNIFFTGAFYWRKPILPALFYYLHILFVLVGPFIAFRHLVYMPLHGDSWSFVIYLGGIAFVGFMFGLAFKLENKTSHMWIYRPLMSLLSTLILSWIIYYSAFTIRKMVWSRA